MRIATTFTNQYIMRPTSSSSGQQKVSLVPRYAFCALEHGVMRLKEQTHVRTLLPLLLAALLALCAPVYAEERIISKADVKRIFSMRKAEWGAYAPRIADQRWKVKLRAIDTGTAVMAFNPATGMGLSVQPLYIDDSGPPTMLVIGSFYPKDKLPPNLATLRADIVQETQRDLGSLYEVSAQYVKLPPSWEGIELSVVLSNNAQK